MYSDFQYCYSSVQCFKCKSVGHIARHCPTIRTTFNRSRAHSRKPAKKSERKQARDTRRLLQFRARKSVCAIMPFSDISDDDLVKSAPKCVNRPVVKITRVCSPSPELTAALSEINRIKEENAALKVKIAQLTSKDRIIQERYNAKYREAEDLSKQLEALNAKYEGVVRDFDELKAISKLICTELRNANGNLTDKNNPSTSRQQDQTSFHHRDANQDSRQFSGASRYSEGRPTYGSRYQRGPNSYYR